MRRDGQYGIVFGDGWHELSRRQRMMRIIAHSREPMAKRAILGLIKEARARRALADAGALVLSRIDIKAEFSQANVIAAQSCLEALLLDIHAARGIA